MKIPVILASEGVPKIKSGIADGDPQCNLSFTGLPKKQHLNVYHLLVD